MRERLCRWALAAVSLVLCALFALGLLAYTQPMGGAGLRPVLCLGGGDASGGLGLFR